MQKVSQKAVLDDMMARPIPRKKIGIVHLEMVRESRCLYGMKRFRTSTEVAEMVRPLFDKAHREMVAVLTLSTGIRDCNGRGPELLLCRHEGAIQISNREQLFLYYMYP